MHAPLQRRFPMNLAKPCASLLPLLFMLVPLAGCEQTDATPRVIDAQVLLPPPGMGMAVGYFELVNPGSTPLRLRGVTSSDFASVQMHESFSENGMSRMRELKDAEVPPHGSLRFEPGGKHLMLMGGPDNAPADHSYPMILHIIRADGVAQRVETRFKVERASDTHVH